MKLKGHEIDDNVVYTDLFSVGLFTICKCSRLQNMLSSLHEHRKLMFPSFVNRKAEKNRPMNQNITGKGVQRLPA